MRKLVTVLPRFEDKKAAVEITRQIEPDISGYLFSISMINVVFGAAIGGAMFFLGMPNPLLWDMMAGLLHFVPFLGAMVGIGTVTLVAAVTLEGLGAILLVPAAIAQSRCALHLADFLGMALWRAGSFDGGAVAGDSQNCQRARRATRRHRRIYCPLRSG